MTSKLKKRLIEKMVHVLFGMFAMSLRCCSLNAQAWYSTYLPGKYVVFFSKIEFTCFN